MSDENNSTFDEGTNIAPDFDTIRQLNPYGVEYWSARELMLLLGYQTWREFEGVINRAITAFEQTGQRVDDHFVAGYKMVGVGSGAKRRVRDYALSRQACYLVAENGNPRIPQIAAAQVYFAVAARENELRQLAEQQQRRIDLRERVAEGNHSLNELAAQVGVTSNSFGTFHNAGYAGLYGGLNVEQIKTRKQIGPKEDLLDRAGLAELGANALRIGLTENKLRTGEITGENEAIQTHYKAGKAIRSAIEDFGGPMPEDLPAEPSVKPIMDERKKARKHLAAQKTQPQLSMFDDINTTNPSPSDNETPSLDHAGNIEQKDVNDENN